MTDHGELDRDTLLKVCAEVPSVVAYIGKDRTIRYVNRAEMGYAPADVIGEPAAVFVQADFRDAFRELLDTAFASGEPAEFEIPVTDAEEERRWYEGVLRPLREGEAVVGVVVVTRDVTDRHRIEEEARNLRSLVPVCSWCKKVRSDAGFWEELEAYIERLGADRVTHGICPECERKVADDELDDSA